jgi:hypothetical protein
MANGIGGQIKTCVLLKNSCCSTGIRKTFHQMIHGHITADFSPYYPHYHGAAEAAQVTKH